MLAYIALGIDAILLILLLVCIRKTNKLNKKYVKFMNRLGKGSNFEEMLQEFMKEVDKTKEENANLKIELDSLEKRQLKCIQKIGIVRYNAFSDTGSDLCFALALLDFEDNGIVINGVYSRDNVTTTYAKPIENGTSKYTLAKEEVEAIEKAKRTAETYYLTI